MTQSKNPMAKVIEINDIPAAKPRFCTRTPDMMGPNKFPINCPAGINILINQSINQSGK